MAKQLWLLRHGEAEPHGAQGSDADRRLTPLGQEQARHAGAALAALFVEFEAVWSSPKVRALDTAAHACESLGVEPLVHPPLAGGFRREDVTELLAAAGPDARILVVGHEPDLSQLVHDLTGSRIDMKKGGIAAIRMEGSASGTLSVLLRPREIQAIALAGTNAAGAD